MLELRDAKLELVDLVAKDEIELCGERLQHADGLLGDLRLAAAHPLGQLGEQLAEHFGRPSATARGHAVSCAGAGGAARGAPARPARTARPG